MLTAEMLKVYSGEARKIIYGMVDAVWEEENE